MDLLEKEAKLEQVYLGVTLLRNIIPDIKEVSKKLLEAFYSIDPKETPSRLIRKLTEEIKNVQYGTVTLINCFGEEWEKLKKEVGKENKEMVKLNY